MINKEYQLIKEFFKNNLYVLIVLGLTTFSLVMQWYRPISASLVISNIIYYFLLPILVIIFIFKESLLDFGLGIGDFRIWLFYFFITVLIGLPVLFFASKFYSVNQYYSLKFNYYDFLISSVPILFVWEFLLRGFLLFGLKKHFGQASIIIQMVPFVLMHLGKPEVETISCILTGLWFGWIAYRSNSFWPAFLIHVFINFSVNFFVNI
ncbi:MAG: CPBP family intramembrane metalloprotease [Atribacterota bacterium]|nr:CPBP family intramembrane metalloprotease [Atribacterota bacterium]